MFFSAISKTLNWEILTKNLVTFKRSDGLKDMGEGAGRGWIGLAKWCFWGEADTLICIMTGEFHIFSIQI